MLAVKVLRAWFSLSYTLGEVLANKTHPGPGSFCAAGPLGFPRRNNRDKDTGTADYRFPSLCF